MAYGCCGKTFVYYKSYEYCSLKDDTTTIKLKYEHRWKKPSVYQGQYLFNFRKRRSQLTSMESMDRYENARDEYIKKK